MVDERRQMWGTAGVLLSIPGVSIYAVFFLSRFLYEELASAGGFIPTAETTQLIFLLYLPVVGLLISMYAYGAAHDALSKTGLVLNTLVLLITLSLILIERQLIV